MSDMNNKLRRTVRLLVRYFKLQEETLVDEKERGLLWKRIEQDIRKEKRRKIVWTWNSMVAAAIVGVVVGSVFYWEQHRPDSIEEIAEQMMNTNPTGDEINLMLSQNEKIVLEDNSEVVNTCMGDITVNEKQVTETSQAERKYAQLIVPKGKHMRLVLGDGSSLHVNSGTKVIYPRTFDKHRREIFVNGEIFIDVYPDKESPFIVKTEEFDVEVLGTAFNVNAYGEDKHAEVTLMRGVVKLTDRKRQTMQLKPNQQASLDQGMLSGKKTVDARKYMAWTDGLLILESEPLIHVLRRLERYYGKNIQFVDSDCQLLIRGSLDLNCSLDEVLDRISIIAPIIVNKTNDGYSINQKQKL